MIRVLFVCTGNICRSPTAEAVFRALIEGAGLAHAIETDSAGIIDYHQGDAADSRARAAAKKRGFDMRGIRARQVRAADYREFDYLLAMDSRHLQDLKARGSRLGADCDETRVCLLMDFAPEFGARDVPDPYYGGADGFEQVLDMIEAAAAGLLATIRKKHL